MPPALEVDAGSLASAGYGMPRGEDHSTCTADAAKSKQTTCFAKTKDGQLVLQFPLATVGPCNELVANAVALQTVVDQTQALHTLNSAGVRIGRADLAFLSPYPISKLKRFGDYPPRPILKPMPATTTLPM